MNGLRITTCRFMVSRLPSTIDTLAIWAGARRSINQGYDLFLTDKQVFLLIVGTASLKQSPSYCTAAMGYPLLAISWS